MVSLNFLPNPCYCSKGKSGEAVLLCSLVLTKTMKSVILSDGNSDTNPWNSLRFFSLLVGTLRAHLCFIPLPSLGVLIQVLIHWLGYPLTLVLLLVCCFFLYLHLSRHFFLICCVTFVKMGWIVINYDSCIMITTTLIYGTKKWPL